jgi:hypothetical protein
VAAGTALLMAPPAFHRLADNGEETERLVRFSSAMVMGALALLAVGLSLELFVVTTKWTHSMALAWSVGAGCLVFLLGLWFGVGRLR